MKLLQNTVEGLLFGLNNFDGIETDIRITKDKGLVIHHDPMLKDGTFLVDLTVDELKERGVPSLEDFFSHPDLQGLLKKGKVLWIETKPNCKGKFPVKREIAQDIYDEFTKLVEQYNIPRDNIHILSFAKELLQPFIKDYKPYPILPYVNECDQRWI